MIHLLNAEFYKIRKFKAAYICAVIAVGFVFLFYAMLFLAGNMQDGGIESIIEQLTLIDVIAQLFSSGVAELITGAFVCVFVIGEFTHGAIKNVVGKGYARWKVFAAKYITALSICLLIFLLMSAANFFTGRGLLGAENISSVSIENLMLYTALQIILGLSLMGVIVTVSELCRSVGAGIAWSCGILLFSSIVTNLFDIILHPIGVKASDYWLMDLMANCPLSDVSGTFIAQTIGVSVLWILISLGVGIRHFQRADVK